MPTAITTITHQLGSTLMLNAIDAAGNKWLASVVDGGTSTPPPKLRNANRPYGHGGFRARSYWGPRLLTISGVAECRNGLAAEQAADLVRGLFTDGGEITYTRSSRQGSRTLQVELADRLQVDILAGASVFRYQIPLRANDPRYLDTTAQISTATVGASSTSGLDWTGGGAGGLDWATGGGLDWGTDASNGVLTMPNGGNTDAYPLIVITGPVTNPTITDPATGRVVGYNGLVDVGQTLTIDMSPFTRSVLLNGIDRSAALSSAQWITIPKNTTRLLQFAGSGTGTATATLYAAWA